LFIFSFEERPRLSLAEERDLRPALHSEIRVALVYNRQTFLQQDLYPALSGGEIVDLPPISEGVRRGFSRAPEPARSTVAAVLDYPMISLFKVSVPLHLLDSSGRPDFSSVRLVDGDRRLWWLQTILSPGVQAYTPFSRSTPNDHFTAGPDCRVKPSDRRGIHCGCIAPSIISAWTINRFGNFGQEIHQGLDRTGVRRIIVVSKTKIQYHRGRFQNRQSTFAR
jgi:hypothetical protein